jgi:hypothetical protein
MNYAQVFTDWVKGALLSDLKPEQRRALPLIVSGAASAEQMQAAGEPFVFGIKQAAKFSTRSTTAGPVERAQPGENVIPWVLSDATPDRMGDVISPDGWDLEHFRKNPVIMWGHGGGGVLDGDEPIGRAEKVRVEKGKLVADIRFAVEESDRAARKFRLANSGYIKAGSVGFKPKVVERVDDEDERRKLGLGKFGVLYRSQELLEFSLVAVPANPHALQQSVKAGEIQTEDADWLMTQVATLTERDLERAARRKSATLVTVAPPPPEEPKVAEALRGAPDDSIIRFMLEPVAMLRSEMFAKTQHEQAEAVHTLSATCAMFARAITDLGNRLGAMSAPVAAPVADAGTPKAEGRVDEVAILQALLKLRKQNN